jgi:predicted SAM-dependent methyltransferase
MERNEMHDYVEELQGFGTHGIPRGKAAAILRRVTSHDMRENAKLRSTKLLRPWSRKRAEKVAASTRPLMLHLGSGTHYLDGWVNLDIVGMGADVYWDLRDPLPFDDNSADGIFCEHTLEHFVLVGGIELLAECFRVLKPAALCRFGVPDFGKYILSYAGDRSELESLRPGRPTPLLAVAEVVLAHGHRSAWDGETLRAVMENAGFVDVSVKPWGETGFATNPDSVSRRAESVYAEGIKPKR